MVDMSGNAENPQGNGEETHPEIAWWMKYLVKGIGSIAGGVALACGVWTCLSFKVSCIIVGVMLSCFGFTVILFEMPCCCQFLDCVGSVGRFGDRRPYWQKAVIYIVFGIIPALLCFGMSLVPGAAGIFATGVLYGMFVLGRKADRDTMQQRASTEGKDDMKMNLVENDSNSKSYSGGKK